MIFDKLDHLDQAIKDKKIVSLITESLLELQKEDWKTGSRTLDSRVDLICTEYETFGFDEIQSESHDKHLDLVILLQGRELLYSGFREDHTVMQPYNCREDITKYLNRQEPVQVVLDPGKFVLFTPSDVHHPGVVAGNKEHIMKATFKILIGGTENG